MLPVARVRTAAAILVLSATTVGCLRQSSPTDPRSEADALRVLAPASPARSGPNGGGWYPLEIGNRWRLHGHKVIQRLRPDSPPQVIVDSSFEVELELTCGDSGDVIERFHESFTNGGELTIHRRYHQDRDALWVVPVELLSTTCDGGAHPTGATTQLLAYPLHPGQSWTYQTIGSLQTTATVEGHETLDTPIGRVPAWRIRIESPFLKPGRDHQHVWYGRSGYLGLAIHVENDAVEDGVPVVVTSDETHSIESIQLAGAGRFAQRIRALGGMDR